MAYQVIGDGAATVLLVPGFATNLEIGWEYPNIAAFHERLATFARVVLFDKVGMGVSERLTVGEIDTLEDRVQDMLAVLDAAEIGDAIVVGISEGGPMSILLAGTHPERVSRLVLVASFARSPLKNEVMPDLSDLWGRGYVFAQLAALDLSHPSLRPKRSSSPSTPGSSVCR